MRVTIKKYYAGKHAGAVHGSFEMHPTKDQTEKMKIASAFFGILSFPVGVSLAACIVKLIRKQKN